MTDPDHDDESGTARSVVTDLTISDGPTSEWPAEILIRALATFGRHLVGCASARGSERDCDCGYLSFFTAAERDALRIPTTCWDGFRGPNCRTHDGRPNWCDVHGARP